MPKVILALTAELLRIHAADSPDNFPVRTAYTVRRTLYGVHCTHTVRIFTCLARVSTCTKPEITQPETTVTTSSALKHGTCTPAQGELLQQQCSAGVSG
jgi:hypothetical protein